MKARIVDTGTKYFAMSLSPLPAPALDQEYEAQVGLKTQLSKDVAPVKISQQSSDLTSLKSIR
jgi:hypothetical protein